MVTKCKNISRFLITEEKTIFQAMKILNKSTPPILFVHSDNKLLASVTDGDIRRWILKGGELDVPIKQVANYCPIFLNEDEDYLANKIMKEASIDAIPLVDVEKNIIKIYFFNKQIKNFEAFGENVPVIIMAGGIGSRLSPYTKILPKPLIPIGELPISEHVINQFRKYGCNDFRMIVNYKRNMIKSYFDELEKDYTVSYIDEESALGTGGGISLLRDSIDSTFILTNCDILINDDLNKVYEQHKKRKNIITMVSPLKNYTIPYGVVTVGKEGNVESIQEKPNMGFYINAGCYFIEPEVIKILKYNEPIDFPDVIKECLKEGKRVGIYPIDENAWLDMGQIDELEKMKENLYAQEIRV